MGNISFSEDHKNFITLNYDTQIIGDLAVGGSLYISDVEDIKEELKELNEHIHQLRLLHDEDYTRSIKIKDILSKYKELINTDIWFEAAKEFLNKKIDRLFNSKILIGHIVDKNYVDNYIYYDNTNRNISSIKPHVNYDSIDLPEYAFEIFCITYSLRKNKNL